MPKPLENFAGRTFGLLTVLNRTGNRSGKTAWLCRCECGKETVVMAGNLKHGRTISCGDDAHRGDGRTQHYLYTTWKAIRRRTTNPESVGWERYGGRGISLYGPWESDPLVFFAWVDENLGPKPSPEHTLDRIDNDAGYFPGNLRWATKKEQGANRLNHNSGGEYYQMRKKIAELEARLAICTCVE